MAFLRASAALSASSHADTHNPFRFSSSSSAAFLRLGRRSGKDGVLVAMAAARETNSRPLADVVFEPFEELKKEQQLVPQAPQASLARHKYSLECEDAINQQINIEYTVSYVYHAMYAYFDRDNVALKGLAKFFKEACDEEREHAEIFMEYQVATKHNDAQMANFIESEFLTEQVDVIKKISEYVAQLRRVGKGHGVWHFDQMLLHEEAAA